MEAPGGREDTEGDVPKETPKDSTPEAEAPLGEEAAEAEPSVPEERVDVVEEVEAPPVVEAPVAPEPPPRRRSYVWLWIAAVLLAAAIVGSVIGVNLGGRQGGPLANQAAGSGRPTIVVATVAAAPSVAVPSPSVIAAATPIVAGATVLTAPATTYTVQPGDTLQSIAEEQYGDAGMWPRIYQANRDAIGPDPDNLVAGTTLTLPPP